MNSGWMSVGTFMRMLGAGAGLQRASGNAVDVFRAADSWAVHVKSSGVSVKAATTVAHDRMNDSK